MSGPESTAELMVSVSCPPLVICSDSVGSVPTKVPLPNSWPKPSEARSSLSCGF